MSDTTKKTDIRFAAAALRYGLRHCGLTNPNPCVAAIVVQHADGLSRVVGRGVTAPGGRPHAETIAIDMAGEAARGAALYVTLEPCSHFGKTPPCTDAILTSGIQKVVACTKDPDLRVSGTGLDRLRAAGVEVVDPNLGIKAQRVHAAHISTITIGRPFVFLKMAVSMDGMIGMKNTGQIAISGPHAWNYVQLLRMQSDAILVGSNTVTSDNPKLTCRLPGLEECSPLRVVLSSDRTKFEHAEVLNSQEVAKTIILEGHEPAEVLEALSIHNIQSLMIEGGATIAAAFLSAGLIDAIHLIRSDVIVGTDGIAAPLSLMINPASFDLADQRKLGSDDLSLYWRKG